MRLHTGRRTLGCMGLIVLLLFCPPGNAARADIAATYTVNDLSETYDGTCNATQCSLREAIHAANDHLGGDTIQFSVSGALTLNASLPTILFNGGALTINGAGQDVVIRGAETVRIFFVENRGVLTLQNLELRQGRAATDGGAIYNLGTLTIADCTLADHRAADRGGAIYNEGTLTVTDTDFSNNIADGTNGGAIYIQKGHVNITGGKFIANEATFSGGAIYNRYEAEYLGGNLTISGTAFLLNRTFGGPGGAIGNQNDLNMDGGGFMLNTAQNEGGAIYNEPGGTFALSNITMSYNTSTFSNGGGIYTDSRSGTSSIRDSSIEHNSADDNGGGFYVVEGTVVIRTTRLAYNDADEDGGAGYNNEGTVTLISNTFHHNRADLNGGGLYNQKNMTIIGSTFSGNNAGGYGGGVYHASGAPNLIVKNSTFYGNLATQGGGMYGRDSMTITNCTFSANRADADEGGALNVGGVAFVRNSIVADSTGGGNCRATSPPLNDGNNIDSGTTCNFGTAKGSMSNTDALLGALMGNGGSTETMLPGSASPAVDGVTYDAPNDCPETDQRDMPRPFGARCDIGSVERYFQIFLSVIRR